MIQPIVLMQVSQIMHEVYGHPPDKAVSETVRLLQTLERHGLQVIRGEWLIPEVVHVSRGPVTTSGEPTIEDRWTRLAEQYSEQRGEIEARQPWKIEGTE